MAMETPIISSILFILISAFPLFRLLAAQSIYPNNNTNPFCAHKPDGLYPEPRNPSYFWRCSANGLRGSLLLCPPSKPFWNQSSLSCSPPSPPSSSSHPSCSSMPNQTSSSDAAAAASINIMCRNTSSNNNNLTTLFPAPSSGSSDLVSTLPNHNNNFWGWNGMLHCYGGGCAAPATSTLPPDMELGIPCADGSQLLRLAQRYASAWIPAPHFGGGNDEEELGSQHWKVRFDSLEKGSPSLLRATVTDFSPAQKVEGAWQGGPGEAKFAIRGPLRDGHGGCYYGLTLEKPSFGDVWGPFVQALSMEGVEPVGVPDQTSYRSRRSTVPTMQKCIRQLPWPRLLSTALCFASNANNNALNRLGPCISFSPSDLSSLATCLSAFANLAPSNSQP